MLMLTIKKVWLWLKAYWYVPFVAIATLFFFIISRDKKIIDWNAILDSIKSSHQKEIENLERSFQFEKAAQERALRRARDVERQIYEEYERNDRQIDKQKQKRITNIIQKLRNDPQALANELEKETGYHVIIVD